MWVMHGSPSVLTLGRCQSQSPLPPWRCPLCTSASRRRPSSLARRRRHGRTSTGAALGVLPAPDTAGYLLVTHRCVCVCVWARRVCARMRARSNARRYGRGEGVQIRGDLWAITSSTPPSSKRETDTERKGRGYMLQASCCVPAPPLPPYSAQQKVTKCRQQYGAPSVMEGGGVGRSCNRRKKSVGQETECVIFKIISCQPKVWCIYCHKIINWNLFLPFWKSQFAFGLS